MLSGMPIEIVDPLRRHPRISALAVLVGLVLASPGLAQSSRPQQESPDQPEATAPPEAGKESARRPLVEKIPDSAVERAKLLDNLYALLATAEDEPAAEQTAEAIARLWRASGSETVNLLMGRAAKSVNDKNNALALKLLDAVVELAPDYAEAWSQRAQVLYLEDETQRAVGDLRRALALDPNHFRALEALAQILRESGEKKGALQAFKKLLEVHPFASGAKQVADELEREVGGQGI